MLKGVAIYHHQLLKMGNVPLIRSRLKADMPRKPPSKPSRPMPTPTLPARSLEDEEATYTLWLHGKESFSKSMPTSSTPPRLRTFGYVNFANMKAYLGNRRML